MNGRGVGDDEEEGVKGHDDAHGGKLKEDTDSGGHAQGEWMVVSGSFEEGNQSDDTDGGKEHGEKGVVGWVHEGVEEDNHAAEDVVGVWYIGVWEAIWIRGEARFTYGRHVMFEASLDEGLVEDEVYGGKGDDGEDEEG